MVQMWKILGNSTMRWASKQLKQALNVSSADVAESLNFTIVDQISQDMLSEESIFHFELLVRITIRMIWLDFPGLVGITLCCRQA